MNQALFYQYSALPVVSLSGELFYLTVPSNQIWLQFLTAIQSGKIKDPYTESLIHNTALFDVNLYKDGWNVNYLKKENDSLIDLSVTELGYFHYTVNQGGYMDDLTSYPRWSNKSKKTGFRPMLIPLDKDKKIDKSFQQYNPDGSILTGGYLSLKRQGYPYMGQVLPGLKPPEIQEFPDCPVLQLVDDVPGSACLFDHMEGPLVWWAFQGMLISTNIIFYSDFMPLWQMGVFPVLLRDFAKHLPKSS